MNSLANIPNYLWCLCEWTGGDLYREDFGFIYQFNKSSGIIGGPEKDL